LRLLSSGIVFLLAASAIFSSCSIFEGEEFELSVVFDCPDLKLNFSDTCQQTILGAPQSFFGFVSEECECSLDTIRMVFDCPDLGLNVGSSCVTANNEAGTVDSECDCVPGFTSEFDCPDLMLNFRDACITSTPDTLAGFVNQNCNCVENSAFDCPDLRLNIGDACITQDSISGTISQNCDCL